MLVESKTLLSIVSLVVLFTSFIASFKHKNGLIFIIGLLASVLINQSDSLAPAVRSKFSQEEKENTISHDSYYIAKTQSTVPMEATIKKIPEELSRFSGVPVEDRVTQALVTQNIGLLESQNMQRSVYGMGRPTIPEVTSGQRSPGELVPNFNTFAHILVGNLRDPNDPQLDVDAAAEQNPELLKLVPPGSKLVAAKDYFASCKNLAPAGHTAIPDPRDARRCYIRSGIY
jgi:hypothetical protein